MLTIKKHYIEHDGSRKGRIAWFSHASLMDYWTGDISQPMPACVQVIVNRLVAGHLIPPSKIPDSCTIHILDEVCAPLPIVYLLDFAEVQPMGKLCVSRGYVVMLSCAQSLISLCTKMVCITINLLIFFLRCCLYSPGLQDFAYKKSAQSNLQGSNANSNRNKSSWELLFLLAPLSHV